MGENSISVRCWREPVTLPTYEPQAADKNPMFLEKRVYQGSSGKVYPLPFIDRIAEKPVPHAWDAIHLENEFLYVMILPQLGGRIHVARDKTNGYDFIYRQDVIKPALVGLAGPWASGGIEFNWPQHHRPSTFMPADFEIENAADGSVTVWLSEHDPMARMKGMHGVCLHPARAVLEVKVRVYNRTPLPQTFLWWANVATRVHERYQSFFPPDVTYVADHAKRAMSTFPLATGHYYGVNYGERARRARVARAGAPLDGALIDGARVRGRRQAPPLPESAPAKFVPPGDYPANDLSWYANIPVPTSYMCMGTEEDFFGGYDHARRAGLVHVADHRIAPGKKQWTWGNHAFGYAWDRNLTDADANGEFAPYIELMAGVFTDNQPDFSFLQPGETKTWSQHWYPIREIGPAQQANVDAALSLHVEGRQATLGVSVTRRFAGATVELVHGGKVISSAKADLAPEAPFTATLALAAGIRETDLRLVVRSADGRELIAYEPKPRPKRPVPPAATEPRAPAEIASADELFLAGLHLDQYRHATRQPTDYWREALRRDAGDARCNHALGLWHLRRGEWTDAEKHFRAAIARLTSRNPNPADGEPYYHLGETLRHQAFTESNFENQESKISAAYDAFAKASWNRACQPAAFHALAELDCRQGNWTKALDHLERALRLNTDNLRARNLKTIVLRRLGRAAEAEALLASTLVLDPLDGWAKLLRGDPLACDTATRLDLVHDYLRAGLAVEAREILTAAMAGASPGTLPLLHSTAAWVCHVLRDKPKSEEHLAAAAGASPDYCFPARLEEIHVLQFAIVANPRDARAPYYLGNLFYDRRRHREAIALWEKSARLDPAFSVVWRNLGIGYFNVLKQPAKARAAYERAVRANPTDARLLYERDQLWKRRRESPAKRWRELEKHRDLIATRDDLTIEFCALLNQVGRHAEALTLIAGRKFQPWEGGEGLALGQHVRTHLALGRAALASGDAATAREHFESALGAPENLGEAKHLLANQSDIHFWLGCAFQALGERSTARQHWTAAATFKGDFQEMSVRAFSEMTFWSAQAWEKLGRRADAKKLLKGLLAHARHLAKTPAEIDYFATSLPTMLLFEEDLQARQVTTAKFLEAQARLGLGEAAKARHLLREVLRRDPSHAAAADLLATGRADYP
jgi:tetratricopeptide (TPR) repeat protein